MGKSIDWKLAVKQLQKMVAKEGVMDRWTPDFTENFRNRLKHLYESVIRIGVAGAQGLGKSTLAKGLISSPEYPNPPISVQVKEETRIPVIAAKADKPGYEEIKLDKNGKDDASMKVVSKLVWGIRLSEDEVRQRTSVDAKVFNKVKFRSLYALRLYDPKFDLDENVEIIDLPGVGGHLADISKWADDFITSGNVTCMIFLVDSSQSIDSSEKEANLIRAYGPQMSRSIFVQNVWSGYDDPVEETREVNLDFLRKHLDLKENPAYLLLDLVKEAECKRKGDPKAYKLLIKELRPYLVVERAAIVLNEVLKLRQQILTIQETLETEHMRAKGCINDFEKHRQAIREILKEINAHERFLKDEVGKEADLMKDIMINKLNELLNKMVDNLTSYLEGSARGVTENLLKKEISTHIGEVNRGLTREFNKQRLSLQNKLIEQTNELNEKLKTKKKKEFTVSDPEIKLELDSRIKFWSIAGKLFKAGVGLGGAAAGFCGGAKVGAAIGSWSGPAGTLIGGLIGGIIGGAIGLFGGSKVDKYSQNKLKQKQKEKFVKEMRSELPKTKENARNQIVESIKILQKAIEDEIQVFVGNHREAVEATLAKEQETESPEKQLQIISTDKNELNHLKVELDKLEEHLKEVS